jgi:ribosomal protein L22
MNRGESSSKIDKRSVSDENEEIVVSSDEEQIIPNNKKIKLLKVQRNTKPFSEIWDYYEKAHKKIMDIMRSFVFIARQNGQEESHKKWKCTWQMNAYNIPKRYQDTGVKL